jgi:hypothetical protein
MARVFDDTLGSDPEHQDRPQRWLSPPTLHKRFVFVVLEARPVLRTLFIEPLESVIRWIHGVPTYEPRHDVMGKTASRAGRPTLRPSRPQRGCARVRAPPARSRAETTRRPPPGADADHLDLDRNTSRDQTEITRRHFQLPTGACARAHWRPAPRSRRCNDRPPGMRGVGAQLA